MPTTRAPLAAGVAAATLLCAACGELDTPNLQTGAVTGSLAGAAMSGGYVYVLGKPDVVGDLRPDGSFTLADVPAGTAKIVMYDGRDRAELVQVEVRGAERSELHRRASEMPRAGKIVAATRCVDQAPSAGAEFEVTGPDGEATRLRATKRGGDAIVLFPVPKGAWKVSVRHSGYRDSERSVQIEESEDELLDVDMEPELAAEQLPAAAAGAREASTQSR